ncbi:hypothetical protein L7F22_046261 [Adiantum nelumboides]|nr:hypothetical protein [Adiantum nelumboides]
MPIVRLRSVHTTSDGRPCVAMELCQGGTLRDMMNARRERGLQYMTSQEGAMVVKEMVRALLFCQANRVLHLDVKPENILLEREGRLQSARLADFGLAVEVPEGRNYVQGERRRGTKGYCAPEVATGAFFSGAADVWSLGAVLLEMLTAILPPTSACSWQRWWETDYVVYAEEQEIRQQMDWDMYFGGVELWPTLEFLARDLLSRMLCPHPKRRITLSQIMDHPWLA